MIRRSMNSAEYSRTYSSRKREVRTRLIPASYAAAAIAAGLTFPRIETHFFPGLVSTVSVGQATAIYSAIASGMIALTGIVFSLAFVMIQFSASTYSPRLVVWISRNPVMSHALGIFTATFLYALAALSWVDRNRSGIVPVGSLLVVFALLLASVDMFIRLIQLIGLLQINRMLIFTGDRGREAIATTYPLAESEVVAKETVDLNGLTCTQTLIHHGRPRSIQAVDVTALVNLAAASSGIIEVAVAVGDTAVKMMPVLRVYGAQQPIDEKELWGGIEIGDERTFEQDPKYAIRLLVDIAIRALSPAINDPTTAVQALDQIEDLLRRLGRRQLDTGRAHDASGTLRVTFPVPTWEDYLALSFDEIRYYGATSVQVMRRLRSALVGLVEVLAMEERRDAVRRYLEHLNQGVGRSSLDEQDRDKALQEDRQGLGLSRKRPQAKGPPGDPLKLPQVAERL